MGLPQRRRDVAAVDRDDGGRRFGRARKIDEGAGDVFGGDFPAQQIAGHVILLAQAAGVTLPEGMNYNLYFPNHLIAMTPPLADDAVEYADGTKATFEQLAGDITTFLAWAAEPELEERKRMGIKVMLFLLVLTGMLYALKRSIWKDQH